MTHEYVLRSPLPDAQIPENISLTKLVLDKAATYGERPALIDDVSGRIVTYQEFVRDCYKMAAGFYQKGLRKGDIVVICSENCIEYPVIWYGTIICGAIIVGFSTTLKKVHLQKMIQNADPKFVCVADKMLEVYTALVDEYHGAFKEFMILGDSSTEHMKYDEILHNDFDPPNIDIDPKNDMASIVYTSGTTGDKKGAISSHFALMARVCCCQSMSMLPRDADDVTIAIRPMAHSYAQCMYFLIGTYRGVTMVIPTDYTTECIARTIETYRVTFYTCVPSELVTMLKCSHVERYDVSSLRCVLVASTYTPEKFLREFGRRVVVPTHAYAMTENDLVTSSTNMNKASSVGKPYPNCEIRIVGVKTGKSLGPNEEGEIFIKSPKLFDRYYKMPDETAAALTEDGWFRTGDMAYYDADGDLFCVGRIKEMLNYGSLKVAPAEIENVLMELPGVAAVAVIGLPDEVYNELPMAYVVKIPGFDIKEEDIHTAVNEQLEDHMKLRGGVKFVDDLPKTELKKINRATVRKQLKRELMIE